MTYPSHLVRDAMRRAIRNHPDHIKIVENIVGERRVNDLRRHELEEILVSLGLDPLAIAKGATLIEAVDHARDNPPQVEEALSDKCADCGIAIPVRSPALCASCQAQRLRATFNHCGNCDTPDKCQGQQMCALGDVSEAEEALTMPAEPAPADTAKPWTAKTKAFDAIEAEVQTIRSLIVEGGFSALDDRLRDLVREARKPAIEVEVIREVMVEAVPGGSAPVHKAQLTGATGTWGNLFGVRGALGKRTCQMWDGSHPSTPAVDPQYVWPQPETAVALTQVARKRNVWLFGPKGTGKTEFAIQLAARLGRPFALISCDESTDAPTLLGMTVPTQEGGVTFQDGVLPKAIRTPGCVVLIDEPSTARAGALMVFQNVLEKRFLTLGENGARVNVAPGVTFIAADNTNGTGGGGRTGYTGTNRVNGATLDRFGVAIDFNYLPRAQEEGVLVARTGCTPELAALLVNGAALTRAAADNQTLSHGLGLRPLIAWAELLTDGIPADVAFKCAVLNKAPETDQETLREQLLLTYDKATVAAALAPSPMVVPGAVVNDPTLTNPTAAGRNAAADFERN